MSFTWSFKGKRSQFYQFGFIINAISKPLEEFLSSCQAFFFGGGGEGGLGGGRDPRSYFATNHIRLPVGRTSCECVTTTLCSYQWKWNSFPDSIQDVAVFFSGPRVALILFQSNRLYGALYQLNTRQPGSILIPLHPGRVQNSFTFNLLTRKSD